MASTNPHRLLSCHAMNITLLKALVRVVASVRAVFWFGALVLKRKNCVVVLQLFGAGCLVLIVLTHVSEALHLFPWMHWGLEHSAGH